MIISWTQTAADFIFHDSIKTLVLIWTADDDLVVVLLILQNKAQLPIKQRKGLVSLSVFSELNPDKTNLSWMDRTDLLLECSVQSLTRDQRLRLWDYLQHPSFSKTTQKTPSLTILRLEQRSVSQPPTHHRHWLK